MYSCCLQILVMESLIEKSKPILQEAARLDRDDSRMEAVAMYYKGISVLMQGLQSSFSLFFIILDFPTIFCLSFCIFTTKIGPLSELFLRQTGLLLCLSFNIFSFFYCELGLGSEVTASQKEYLRTTIANYLSRAECLKGQAKVKVEFLEQRHIKAGTVSSSHQHIFILKKLKFQSAEDEKIIQFQMFFFLFFHQGFVPFRFVFVLGKRVNFGCAFCFSVFSSFQLPGSVIEFIF